MAKKTDPVAREEAAQRVSAWLQDRLRLREWSTSDLARSLGVQPSSVSRWVRGVQPPSPEYCIRLADVFNEDPDVVLALAGHRLPEEEVAPDDPASRLFALAKRVDWSKEDRFEQIEFTLRRWAEKDRQPARKAQP